MKKQLKDKQAALQSTSRRPTANIIKTGSGEWGLAALVMLGKVQENMADALLNCRRSRST